MGRITQINCLDTTRILWIYLIILSYWIINFAYCFILKQFAIVDIFCIAIGFVLRVFIGGIATGIWISQWIILLTFLLSLFLALTKRYDDFNIYEKTGIAPRQSIVGYNTLFINISISIVAAVTLVCYIMYTMSETVIERMSTHHLYLTAIWATAGIFRYIQNMLVYQRSSSPTAQLINDHFIHLCILGWLLSFFFILYF